MVTGVVICVDMSNSGADSFGAGVDTESDGALGKLNPDLRLRVTYPVADCLGRLPLMPRNPIFQCR